MFRNLFGAPGLFGLVAFLIVFGIILAGVGVLWWGLFCIVLGVSFGLLGAGYKQAGFAALAIAAMCLLAALVLQSDWLLSILESSPSPPE